MDEGQLSDHEWRQKMAAEGKALYVPGKTAKEIRADRAKRASATVSLTLSLEEAQALETAVVDLPELIHQTKQALDTLVPAMSVGGLDGNDLMPILALFARGMQSADTRELAALEAFDLHLRTGLSQYQEAIRAQSEERSTKA